MNTTISHGTQLESLEDFLREVKTLIRRCQKQKTIEEICCLSDEKRREMLATAFLLTDEWSELFLTLIFHKRIEDLIALEDFVIESANREVMQAIKNLLELFLHQKPESDLWLYKLRRLYYALSTYYSQEEPAMGYQIPLYKPQLSFPWVFSLEDLL